MSATSKPDISLSRIAPFLLTALAFLAVLLPAKTALAGSTTLVIAEAYGGGGNSGSTYKNDFIVVFNRGTTPVDVNGWSVQWVSATGTGTWTATPLATTSKIIPPGGYFLVQEAAGTSGTTDLPTPDAIGTATMGASSFKVALVNNSTPLVGGCPTGAHIIDLVGAGATANCFEGAPAPAPSNTTSVQRAFGGCQDNDNNATDFTAGAPNPRNSASPLNVCPSGAIAPTITTQPTALTRLLTENATFTVLASGTAPLSYQWYRGLTALTDDAQTTGATTASLTVSNLTYANAGDYTVVVTNTAGSVTSDPANLNVINPPPVIYSGPADQTDLRGTTIAMRVTAYGVPPYTYQWQKDGVDITEGGQFTGATSNVLTIANIDVANQGAYTCIVTTSGGTTTSTAANLTVADSGPLVRWDFNMVGNDPAGPAPSQGVASATTDVLGTFTDGFIPANGGGSASDPIATVMGATNYYWGTSDYPAQGLGNKSAGVQFAVSTAGFKNIGVSYNHRATSTSSKYTRLQYTVNGTDFLDFPASSSFASASIWETRSFSLAGFTGVADNPNFAIRVVSEFADTATYGISNTAAYVGITSSYGTGGTLSYDMVTITADKITGAFTPPTIAPIADASAPVTAATLDVPFTVTGTAPFTAEAATGNPLVASGASASVTGNSGTVSISLSGLDGQSPVWITVTDANGDKATALFTFTATPVNPAPHITQLSYTNTLVDTPITIPFVIGDHPTPAGSLVLAKASANLVLIPDANIVFGGSGSNRTVTLTAAAGVAGMAPITLTVTDGGGVSASTTFTLIVRPSTDVVLNEFFDYADGSVTAVSSNLWATHSGTAGQMNVNAGVLNVTQSESEDCNVPLYGQPFTTNNGDYVLYSSFKLKLTTMPTEAGGYFAHFKDDGTGFRARVFASTSNAPAGSFRLSIGNSSPAHAGTGQLAENLQLDTTYTVVTRLDLSNSLSTLWVNPTSESSPNVNGTDPLATNFIAFAYAFRQSGGIGVSTVDDVRVGTTFASVVPGALPDPVPLTIEQVGNDVVLSWTDSRFRLQTRTSLPSGDWADVPNATSPHTTAINGTAFYRLAY